MAPPQQRDPVTVTPLCPPMPAPQRCAAEAVTQLCHPVIAAAVSPPCPRLSPPHGPAGPAPGPAPRPSRLPSGRGHGGARRGPPRHRQRCAAAGAAQGRDRGPDQGVLRAPGGAKGRRDARAAGGRRGLPPLGHRPVPSLQNDHKAVMKQVEEALHKLHAREKEKHAKDEAEALAEAMSQSQSLPRAFAKVNSVSPGSPASVSGLQVDDEIVEFGSVNANNFQNLQNIATVVQHSEGRPLSVTVIRGGRRVHVGLTPKRWAGKGLLGCNIIPLQR
ncbi:26S proteasome non-ATPase regulatory subunit 9 isoform X1 [Agelaius phoeniceus]|uniref:26S proteasome non-ATPase regulatory subunit 9 isoform X1 n=1 Tax=Agelaius phoeniceus TaxID=39638 RepID=UPI004054EED5